MAYDYRCPKCGAYLDPGEHCDCEQEKDIADVNSGKIISYKQHGEQPCYEHCKQAIEEWLESEVEE